MAVAANTNSFTNMAILAKKKPCATSNTKFHKTNILKKLALIRIVEINDNECQALETDSIFRASLISNSVNFSEVLIIVYLISFPYIYSSFSCLELPSCSKCHWLNRVVLQYSQNYTFR